MEAQHQAPVPLCLSGRDEAEGCGGGGVFRSVHGPSGARALV